MAVKVTISKTPTVNVTASTSGGVTVAGGTASSSKIRTQIRDSAQVVGSSVRNVGPSGSDGEDGQDGSNGKSAYEIAKDHGFIGTEVEWLESLKGEDFRYEHHQTEPSAEWIINHNAGRYPNVTFIDTSGRRVRGQVDYPSMNQVIGRFSAPFAGIATLD